MNVVLQYSTVAPVSWKRGFVKCFFFDHATSVCSNSTIFEEVSKLREMFTKKSYPTKFFDPIKQQLFVNPNKISVTTQNSKSMETDKKSTGLFLKIPYVCKISNTFERIRKSLLQRKDQDFKIVYEITKVQNSFH